MSSDSVDGIPYVGAMMRLGWQWVRDEIFSGVVAAGYDDVTPAHVGLFRYPGLDGQRPTELAEQMHITKQSVNDLLGHLEQHGYLIREADLADGRARVVHLTPQGRRLEKAVTSQSQAAEVRIAEILGSRSFGHLRRALGNLAEAVTRNAPVQSATE
ncbi:MAG: MarR family winged helix-turn-helix transcriptional regulator [Acidimicrobiales bacterium]